MRRFFRRRPAVVLLGVAYFAGLALVDLWPVHVDGPGGLLDVQPLLEAIARLGVPAWRSYPWVEFGGNVLMFVPFGVIVGIAATDWCLWLAPTGALVASGLFELAQAIVIPSRTPDARDVAAATLGAFVGALATWAVIRWRPFAPRADASDVGDKSSR